MPASSTVHPFIAGAPPAEEAGSHASHWDRAQRAAQSPDVRLGDVRLPGLGSEDALEMAGGMERAR